MLCNQKHLPGTAASFVMNQWILFFFVFKFSEETAQSTLGQLHDDDI